MFTGVPSDTIEKIKQKSDNQVKKEADRAKAQAETKPEEVQDLTKEIQDTLTEITTLKGKLEQKKSTLLKADICLNTLCFMQLPAIQMSWSGFRRSRRTGDWRQMTIHFGKAKGQRSKGPQKEKDQKVLKQITTSKGEVKRKGKTKSKGQGPWTTWPWKQNQNQSWNQNQGDQVGHKKANTGKARPIVRYVTNQVIKLINAGGRISSKDLRLSNHLRTQDQFTISQSILRINPLRLCSQINSEAFKTYDLQLNNFNNKVRAKHPLTRVSVLCSVSLWPSRRTQWS